MTDSSGLVVEPISSNTRCEEDDRFAEAAEDDDDACTPGAPSEGAMGLGVRAREGAGELALKVDSAAKSMRGECDCGLKKERADGRKDGIKSNRRRQTGGRESSIHPLFASAQQPSSSR